MSECEKCLELHKLIAAEERISELERELDSLKPGTIKTMTLCECGRHYHLPSDKCCDKCMIAELEQQLDLSRRWNEDLNAQLAAHEWVSVEDRLPEHREGHYWSDLVLVMDKKSHAIRLDWYDTDLKCWVESVLIKYTHWKPIHLPKAKPAVDAEREAE